MSDLTALLNQFEKRRVLVVGDLMLDRFIYGSVERISPEAPIPVLHVTRETANLGGAGNVVRNISTLGGVVELVGIVGADLAGKEVIDLAAADEKIHPHLLSDASRPTIVKTRYVSSNQQMLRADYESSKPLSADMEQKVIKRIREDMRECDVVILSDYAKGLLTPAVIEAAIEAANAGGKISIVDPKGRDFTRYRGATFLTPNRKEISEAAGFKVVTVQDAEKAARELMAKAGVRNMLVKLGSDGVCLVQNGVPALHFKTLAKEVFDVSGAGDTVAATLAMALAAGYKAEEAAQLANLAGSIVVGKVGTATINRDDIAREILFGTAQLSESKVVGLTTAIDIAERWHKQGLKIGFTNGVFDLLHPGHISLIRQARAECDKLIVGLNSDASVKRLKGAGRPIQGEAARAAVLASLGDIDQVVIFGEDTPFEIIKALRPDVLVKGADYSVASVIGADLVQSWGGKVVIAHLEEGFSTSKTIEKMKG